MNNNSNTLCIHEFSRDESNAIWGVTLFSALLSLLGSSFIILTYFLFPRIRTFPYKLIMFLSLADLGSCLSYFIGLSTDYDNQLCSTEATCYASAVMTQFFDVATFLWTGGIAINIYLVIVKDLNTAVESLEKYYHLICWGIPGILALVCGATKIYGDAGLWCWIVETAKIEMFFYYYLPLLLVLVMNAILVILIHRHFKYSSSMSSAQSLLVTSRVRMYLMIFVLVRIWSILDKIADLYTDRPIFALALLHAIFSPVQGFANALVYGLNRAVVNSWRNQCKCCRKRVVQNDFNGDGIGDDGALDSQNGRSLRDVSGGLGTELPPFIDASSLRIT